MNFSIVTDSMWLWLSVGTALWAFLGVHAAAATRLPLWVGAVAGMIGWFFGVAGVLGYGLLTRRERHAVPNRLGPETRFWRLVLTGIALASAAGMVLSIFMSWGRWQAQWLSGDQHRLGGGLSPSQAPWFAFVLLLSAALVGGSAVVAWLRPRSAWLVLGTLIATWWFTAITQTLIIVPRVRGSERLATQVGGQFVQGRLAGGLSLNHGLWVMFASCVGVISWAVLSTVLLLRRGPAPTSRAAWPYPAPPPDRNGPAHTTNTSEWGFE